MEEIIAVVIAVFYMLANLFAIVFLISYFAHRKKLVNRLRNGNCIFENKRLQSDMIYCDSYTKPGKEVYKTGFEDGRLYVEKNPTMTKGEYVRGTKVYLLKSEKYGYIISRTEVPSEKCITPKWTLDGDTPSYKETYVNYFRLETAGNLSPKQVKKLQKIASRARFEW